MRTFPIDKLLPTVATLVGQPRDASLEVALMPFELDGDDVETSIRLEGIDLPTLNWSDLEGQEFAFPANPDQGYIDGSVYMDSAHHPVDVTSIRFDHATDTQPQVTISGVLNLEYEGLRDYANAVFALTAPLVLR